jgi:hypothetical protein
MSNRRTISALFLLLSLLFLWYSLWLSGWFYFLLWPALSFLLVSLAYLGLGPSMLAKRPDGSLPARTYLLLGPYLLLSWLGWIGLKLSQGNSPWNEVAPGIFVSRRLAEHELPPDTSVIVDMTCELTTLHPNRNNRRYLCVPTLDATAPEAAATMELLASLREERGRILIHCAAGHGRSATIAAALLMVRGLAVGVDEAESFLQKSRRKIKLNAEQKRLLLSLSLTIGPL